MPSKYIYLLPESTQQAIKHDLIAAFKELGLSKIEQNEALENAMNSKLVDLSETIDINKYLADCK